MIRLGQIRDCPVTLEDVNNAEMIFGKDMATIKGKTTRQKPPPVTASVHAVPDELVAHNKILQAAMDVFFICGLKFLAFLDLSVRHRATTYIKNKSASTFYKALDGIMDTYNSNGFRIGTIHCDQEFKSLMDPVKNDMELKLEHPAAQAHANHAERNVRHLEERIRCAWHATPFLIMPIIMIVELVKDVTNKLNLFPAKQGISQVYSPRQILTGRTTDYRSVEHTFGSFCIAHDQPKPSNTNEPRGLECIYLRPILENNTGGHVLLDLHTWEVITRQTFTVLPMTAEVIRRVQAKAKEDGMKPLKFHNRKSLLLLNGKKDCLNQNQPTMN